MSEDREIDTENQENTLPQPESEKRNATIEKGALFPDWENHVREIRRENARTVPVNVLFDQRPIYFNSFTLMERFTKEVAKNPDQKDKLAEEYAEYLKQLKEKGQMNRPNQLMLVVTKDDSGEYRFLKMRGKREDLGITSLASGGIDDIGGTNWPTAEQSDVELDMIDTVYDELDEELGIDAVRINKIVLGGVDPKTQSLPDHRIVDGLKRKEPRAAGYKTYFPTIVFVEGQELESDGSNVDLEWLSADELEEGFNANEGAIDENKNQANKEILEYFRKQYMQ